MWMQGSLGGAWGGMVWSGFDACSVLFMDELRLL